MSFRDAAEQKDFSSSVTKEFHPIQDLIETVRSNREQRIHDRAERRAARHEQHGHNDSLDNSLPKELQFSGQIKPVRPASPASPANPANMARPEGANEIPVPLPLPLSVIRAGYKDETPVQVADNRRPAPSYLPPPGVPRFDQQGNKTEAPKAEPPTEAFTRPEYTDFPKFSDRKVEQSEQVLPEPIVVKENNGAVVQIPEAKNLNADDRLSAYMTARGVAATELDLNGTRVTDAGLGKLGMAPNLQKLWLNDCDVDNDSMKVLGAQGLRNLKDLNLHSTRVGDEGVAQLVKMPLINLNLSDTAVSDDCMQQIKSMKTLQVLNLDYSGVGNEGVRAVQQMPSLKALSLKGCPVTDDCVKDLAKCQQLMVLNLDDTKLSAKQVQWLQDKMPKCVITAPEGSGDANQGRNHRRPDKPERPDKHERRPFRLFPGRN